jgi:carbonic anhydrase
MPDLTDPVTGAVLPPADKLSVANVAVQVRHLRDFECVREAERDGNLELIGLWFDLGTASTRVVHCESPYLTTLPDPSPATARRAPTLDE